MPHSAARTGHTETTAEHVGFLSAPPSTNTSENTGVAHSPYPVPMQPPAPGILERGQAPSLQRQTARPPRVYPPQLPVRVDATAWKHTGEAKGGGASHASVQTTEGAKHR